MGTGAATRGNRGLCHRRLDVPRRRRPGEPEAVGGQASTGSGGRVRYESDVGVDDRERGPGRGVELMVSEGATHQLGPDDVRRARWWIRGMVEDSTRRLPCHVPGMLV